MVGRGPRQIHQKQHGNITLLFDPFTVKPFSGHPAGLFSDGKIQKSVVVEFIPFKPGAQQNKAFGFEKFKAEGWLE